MLLKYKIILLFLVRNLRHAFRKHNKLRFIKAIGITTNKQSKIIVDG